nr:MAG TPA: hypothetical protein [Caudoviricetes sp.]
MRVRKESSYLANIPRVNPRNIRVGYLTSK